MTTGAQANLPICSTTTDLQAFYPDGLESGHVAVTTSPFAFWLYSPTTPAAGVSYVTSSRTGYWQQYNGVLTGEVWLNVSGAFNVAAGANYNVNLSAAPSTATLPAAPAAGEKHTLVDNKLAAATHNLTIAGNGNNIEQIGGATTGANLVLNTNGASVTIEFDGTEWVIS